MANGCKQSSVAGASVAAPYLIKKGDGGRERDREGEFRERGRDRIFRRNYLSQFVSLIIAD